MKILIVDDNKDITDMLSKYLKMKEYDCTVSSDGINGLNLIKTGNFDYVLLDMSMPKFSGVDVIEDLEKEELLKKQKIVIFTASSISNEEIEKLLKKQGVITVLKKPVQLSEILTIISV